LASKSKITPEFHQSVGYFVQPVEQIGLHWHVAHPAMVLRIEPSPPEVEGTARDDGNISRTEGWGQR